MLASVSLAKLVRSPEYQERVQKRFVEKLGMDPRGVMQHARDMGRDPIFALLQRLEQRDPVVRHWMQRWQRRPQPDWQPLLP